jgi:hypothetical protein
MLRLAAADEMNQIGTSRGVDAACLAGIGWIADSTVRALTNRLRFNGLSIHSGLM